MSAPRTRTRKAVLAGTAGIALLAAGGGSFATWSDTEDLGGATITSGHLRIDGATERWTDAAGAPIVIDDYRVIPGSVLTYTATVDVALAGDGLEAVLGTTLPTAATAATTDGNDATFARGLNVEVSVNGETGAEITTSGEYTVVATIEFLEQTPEGFDWGQTAQNAAAELADFQITLEQKIA